MGKLILFVAVLACGWRPVMAQDAEVTFYSKGSLFESGVPGTKNAFKGNVFDGQDRLAELRHGRFITLRLTVGPHVFSASYGSHPGSGNSRLEMTLVAGTSYFISAVSEARGVVLLDIPMGRLIEATCNAAHQDTEKSVALEEKHVGAAAKGKVVAGMPTCP